MFRVLVSLPADAGIKNVLDYAIQIRFTHPRNVVGGDQVVRKPLQLVAGLSLAPVGGIRPSVKKPQVLPIIGAAPYTDREIRVNDDSLSVNGELPFLFIVERQATGVTVFSQCVVD